MRKQNKKRNSTVDTGIEKALDISISRTRKQYQQSISSLHATPHHHYHHLNKVLSPNTCFSGSASDLIFSLIRPAHFPPLPLQSYSHFQACLLLLPFPTSPHPSPGTSSHNILFSTHP